MIPIPNMGYPQKYLNAIWLQLQSDNFYEKYFINLKNRVSKTLNKIMVVMGIYTLTFSLSILISPGNLPIHENFSPKK